MPEDRPGEKAEGTRGVRFALRLTERESERWRGVQRALGASSLSDAVRAVMSSTADALLSGGGSGKQTKGRKKK